MSRYPLKNQMKIQIVEMVGCSLTGLKICVIYGVPFKVDSVDKLLNYKTFCR